MCAKVRMADVMWCVSLFLLLTVTGRLDTCPINTLSIGICRDPDVGDIQTQSTHRGVGFLLPATDPRSTVEVFAVVLFVYPHC